MLVVLGVGVGVGEVGSQGWHGSVGDSPVPVGHSDVQTSTLQLVLNLRNRVKEGHVCKTCTW